MILVWFSIANEKEYTDITMTDNFEYAQFNNINLLY